tara:strand:- start:3057 stop:3797 length:741 start_codon:yes stop_codon:yes gene_type:complete
MKAVTGQRILVTRAADDCRVWAQRLTELGAFPVILPCIECQLDEDPATAQALHNALSKANWLVLCSRRAVQAVAQLMNIADSSVPDSVQIATVGPATARSAAELLGRVDFKASQGTAASLCSGLLERLQPNSQVIAALTALSDDTIERRLQTAGATVQRFNVYRSGPVPASPEQTPLGPSNLDLMLLASPSAVTGLLNQARVAKTLPAITIGPTTTRAARAAGLKVLAEATERSLEAILQALEDCS